MPSRISLSTSINLSLVLIFLVAFLVPAPWSFMLKTLSLYGFVGSITNVLAIKMIFDRIPGIIGSGIIEENFDSFKKKLRQTLLDHLFYDGIEFAPLNTKILSKEIYNSLHQSHISFLTNIFSPESFEQFILSLNLNQYVKKAMTADDVDVLLKKNIDRLSCDDIKELLLHILAEHLQWIIIWGAIFGMIFGGLSLLI